MGDIDEIYFREGEYIGGKTSYQLNNSHQAHAANGKFLTV